MYGWNVFMFLTGALLVYRSEAGRLAEENHLLRQKITELKEEDVKEAHQELL